jgi:hypothetical protein
MKNLLFIALITLLAACGNKNNETAKDVNPTDLKNDRLEVYAFHGVRQCETCKHMKAYSKATLEKHFNAELKSGAIVYQVIDVDDEKNAELAEKFEATGTALMINRVQNGKENIEDWSDFAFEYAPGEQNEYEIEFKKMIEEKLK